MSLSVLDIIFILLIIVFVIRCYLKGFVSEVFSMAAIVLGLLASLFFYKNGGQFVRERFLNDMEIVPEVIAFIVLFLTVFLIIKILEKVLSDIIYGIRLGGADRFLGIIFGLAEGVVVASLVLFVLKIQPLFDPSQILSDSLFARILLPIITGQEIISGV